MTNATKTYVLHKRVSVNVSSELVHTLALTKKSTLTTIVPIRYRQFGNNNEELRVFVRFFTQTHTHTTPASRVTYHNKIQYRAISRSASEAYCL